MKKVLLGFIFLTCSLLTHAQVTVSGFVRSSLDNEMLLGANVVVKGTTTGTVTNADGYFELNVPSTDTSLIVSYVGYNTEEFALEGRTSLEIFLSPNLTELEDVVVVGYGTQKKSDVTGSITSVDADKLRDVPSESITKALQGKTAGVEIQNLSRRPGGDTQIRIRGNRSLTADNAPLIVVDGIPFGGSLNDIASDDIASIEILKDASATVIYGSRGANGVIIITTKRGQVGDLRVSYNGFYGVTQVAREYDLYDAEGFVKLRSDANNNNYVPDEIESLLTGRETDWQDLMYQDGHSTNHEVSFSGGTESTQYSITTGFFDETYVLPEIGFRRFNLRLAIDQEITERIKIGITSMNTLSNNTGESVNPQYQIMALSPLAKPYNNDGTLNEQPMYPIEDWYNPMTLQDKERWEEKQRRIATFNTLYAEFEIFDGFKYRLNAGYEFSQNKYNNFYASNTSIRNGLVNQASVDNQDRESYTLENILSYEKAFGNHRLNFTGMQSIQQDITIKSGFDLENIPANYLQYHNPSLAETKDTDSDENYYREWELVSFMARVNYAFDDRYLFTLTGRADGSSRLAPGNKWHNYPAVAVGWNVINEPFMESVTFLSGLKLRAGYGQTSNTSIDPYSTLGALNQTVYNYGDNGVYGYYVNSLPNTNLGWEFTTTTNIGVDFSFLYDRFSGSVDAYIQETEDLLLGKSLPPSTGVQGDYLENVGETENRGIEVVLNGVIFSAPTEEDFFWDVSTNIFLNREKIVALQDPSIEQDIGNGWFVGHPQNSIYYWDKIGIWQLDEAEEAASYGAEPGDIKYADLNDDGTINEDDRKIIGSPQPDFTGGFTSTWGYKRIDLSVVGYYRVGGTIISTLHMPGNYLNRLDGRRNQIEVDYWTPDNPTNDMPQPSAAIDASRTDALGYFDGSFLKIRSINLGYNFSPEITNRIFGEGSSIRIYASLADAFIFFSPYLEKGGLDPEPTNEAEDDQEGLALPDQTLVVGTNTPPTRKIVFGLNIKF